MADSAAVRKQKAAIKARGLKAGYSGSKSSVDATFRRKQERTKARGKSAAAHAKAPGQIKKLPKPPEMSTQPVGNILRASAPGGKIATGPVQMGPAKVSGTMKTMPTGISTVQTSGIRAKAMAAKAMAAKPSKPNTPSGALAKVKAWKSSNTRGNSSAAHARAPGQVKKLLPKPQPKPNTASGALAKPSRLGFSEKKADVTRIALKPGG